MTLVDSLPEGAKEVLQTGSVIEREFVYELLNVVSMKFIITEKLGVKFDEYRNTLRNT